MNEQTLTFGPENHLVGTVTLPATAMPGHVHTMALLTNAGVIPRIGPHRLNVLLARHFAAMGIATMRFDMSGLGDSRRSGSRLSTGEQFVADTRSAMDLAQARFGAVRFFMIGFCSGGDVANLVAHEDDRLRAIVLWDSYVYPTWKAKLIGLVHRLQQQTLGTLARKGLQRAVRRIRPAAQEPGSVPVAQAPSIFGRTQMPPRDDFGRRIRALVDRGVEVFFLYSGGEPRWYNYRGQFSDMFAAYGFVERVEYDYLDRSDHTFIQPRSQQALIARVEQWLETRALPALRGNDVDKAAGVRPSALEAA
jgi:dienelactone hydrolase